MVLSYTLPGAEESITRGVKIHTLRSDKANRWKPGYLIHHATGSSTPNYDCFMMSKVVSVQQVLLVLLDDRGTKYISATIDRRRLSREEVKRLAVNDGFQDEAGMIEWFFKDPAITMWAGKCIHWTKFKY